MKSKFRIWFYRWVLNHWPCIRGTGGRVTYLAPDFTRLTVKLPLNWRTRNIVGTIYGGSLYGSTDPFYMLMLMEILGKDYVVWDKGCTIHFKKPAKETLFAHFEITPAMVKDILDKVAVGNYTTVTWSLEYKSKSGEVFAQFDKQLYIATKASYEMRHKNA